MVSLFFKIWKFLRLPSNIQLFLMRRVNDQFLLGVTGIIFDNNDNILLFKHTYRNNDHWSLPGGYVKAKEHPKEGLEREIKEETGLIVSADSRLKLRTDRDSPRIDVIYVGTYQGGSFEPSPEVKEAQFFSFEELPKLTNDQLYFIDKAMKYKALRSDDRSILLAQASFSPLPRRERNPSEAEISSHSPLRLRSGFSAKGDKRP